MLFCFLPLSVAHSHTPSSSKTHTHTHGHASRELTVSMVLSPGDPGWGLQERERCKLGERWVQRLVSEGLVLFILMLCHSLTPREIQVVGKVKMQGRSSLAQLFVLYCVCIRTVSLNASFMAALSLTLLSSLLDETLQRERAEKQGVSPGERRD